MNDIEKACDYFQGMFSHNPALATEHMHPDLYVEHNPHVHDGVAGVQQYISHIAAGGPYLKIIRAYQDGPYVVTQGDGHIRDHCTFFDVFRFDAGKIVEHWAFSAQAGAPNKSGHTQVDGPTDARQGADTEASKALVREYYEAVHIGGRHDLIPHYVSQDIVRHEPGVADSVDAFMRDVEVLTKDRTIDNIKLLLGQGDFVFLAAEGTHNDEPCVYIDLYRLEESKLVEHWGFPQPVPPLETRKNSNGVL